MDSENSRFADKEETEQRMAALEQRLAAAEAELAAWRNLQIDPASGGGNIVPGSESMILRINALTAPSAQMP